jgi:hypothetical protein
MNYLLISVIVVLVTLGICFCMRYKISLKDCFLLKENYGNSQAFDPSTRASAAGIGPVKEEFCGSCM